jgi:membrane-associated phospholipid phosphatase
MRWFLTPAVVVLAALSSWIAKLAIRRPRPGSAYHLAPWGRLGAAGFPSTHSACAFAAAAWLRPSRPGRWLHVLALLIGYSRVRCRAHHPTDVAAGAILGYGVALQAETIERSFRNKEKIHSYTRMS